MSGEQVFPRSTWSEQLQRWAPEVAIVLGSGLAAVAQEVVSVGQFPLADLANGCAPSVSGHPGVVICGWWAGRRVLVFQGRLHAYEGHPPAVLARPLWYAAQAGAQLLILTNAAGGIRADLQPGSFMLVNGWLSWCQSGASVAALAKTAYLKACPARWTDRTKTEHSSAETVPLWATVQSLPPGPEVRLLLGLAKSLGIRLSEGVLAGVLGPNYETPAEIRALRALGADAVGMSSVFELQLAEHLGLPTLAISCITNRAAGLSCELLCHDEVVQQAARMAQRLASLLQAFLACWRR